MKITIDVDHKTLVFLISQITPPVNFMDDLTKLDLGRIINGDWIWHTAYLEKSTEARLWEVYQRIT